MKKLVIGLAAAALLALTGCTTNAQDTPAVAATTHPPLVIIYMENHERSSIEASADADYLKAFEAAGRSFTHYYGVTHPSLPNYLALGNGSTDGKSGTDSVSAGEISGKSLWSQLQSNSISWGVYEESMPSACYKGTTSGEYALKHNPAMPFSSVSSYPTRCAKVLPFTSFTTTKMRQVSFIAPNLCNDMHDCSIATGDNWLAAHVPAMLSAGAEVAITFDEGSTSTNGGGNIYMAVRGPGIAASTNTTTYNHYSLLAGIEARFGLAKLNSAAGATPLPLG
jgi:hypothetical protein